MNHKLPESAATRGFCRWCMRPEHPSGTMCPKHPDFYSPASQMDADEWDAELAAKRKAAGVPPGMPLGCGGPFPDTKDDIQAAMKQLRRCGKNMGNDLLIIPCDLNRDHDGPCERNIWPVLEEKP